jgi:hypothetical protein
MKVALLILIGIVVGCSNQKAKKPLATETVKLSNDEQRMKCLLKDDSLSCAQYAYSLQKVNPSESLKFYSRGCELGDQSSCYNYKSIKSKSADYNLLLLKKEQLKIFGCYVNFTEDKDKKKFYDLSYDIKTITLDAHISPRGTLRNISIKNGKFSSEGKRCMKSLFKSVRFLPSKQGQRLQLSFIMPEIYDKKSEEGFLEKAVDSLKDVN